MEKVSSQKHKKTKRSVLKKRKQLLEEKLHKHQIIGNIEHG